MEKDKYINDIITEVMPKKLREFRKHARMTTEEVAKIINKTPAMITNYEKGYNIPSAAILFELCRIYGVEDINEVFNDKILTQNFKCNEYLTGSEFEIIKLWRNAKKEGRFAAKVVLEAFRENNIKI